MEEEEGGEVLRGETHHLEGRRIICAEVETTSPGRRLSEGLSRQRFTSSLALQLLSWDQGHVDLRARVRTFRCFIFR